MRTMGGEVFRFFLSDAFLHLGSDHTSVTYIVLIVMSIDYIDFKLFLIICKNLVD